MHRNFESTPSDPFSFEAFKEDDGIYIPIRGKSLGRRWMDDFNNYVWSEDPLYTTVRVPSYYRPPPERDISRPVDTLDYVEAKSTELSEVVITGLIQTALVTRLDSLRKPIIPGLYLINSMELFKEGGLKSLLPDARAINPLIVDLDSVASPLRLRRDLWDGNRDPEDLYRRSG